ncbi:MAG: helix-turn-helix transcriptional regulator [Rhodovibrionaceae bacterium]
MKRQELVERFQERLTQIIQDMGVSRSAFAARIGLDRSTLSQLLTPGNERLPRAETIVAMAQAGQVSSDWLLGLTHEERQGAELVESAMEVESGAGKPMDERLTRWHAEAAGYKIRYVPSTLPDLLKTQDVIRYETQEYGAEVPQKHLEQAENRLAYSRKPETEMEACSSFQTVESIAYGEGIWRKLSLKSRREQLAHMARLVDELYPAFRWFLYDGLQRFSVPYTIFGPQRVAFYVGGMYFVFKTTDQIRVVSQHFDDLIKAATIQPNEVGKFIAKLQRQIAKDKD